VQLFFTFLVAEGAKAGVYIETRAEYSRNIPYSFSLEPSYISTSCKFSDCICRAPVNISQSDVRTSMVLNLDVRYALAIKSDVTLHNIGLLSAYQGWKMASKKPRF